MAIATIRGLDSIRVDIKKLVEVLVQNRDNHIKEYEASVIGWREEASRLLKKKAKEIKTNDEITHLNFNLPKPVSHVKEYDRLIEMMEFTKDEELELDSQSFNQYVRDEWAWSQEFKTMSASYGSRR